MNLLLIGIYIEDDFNRDKIVYEGNRPRYS